MTIKPFTNQAIVLELFGLNYRLPKPRSTADTPEALTPVVEKVKKFGVDKIYKPNVPQLFNGQINLDRENYLKWGNVNDVELYGVPQAEGFAIHAGEAAIIRSADCAPVFCYCPNNQDNSIIAFHAGLRSVLPESSEQKGVVDNAISTAIHLGTEPKETQVFIGPTLGPEHFIYSANDPVYGEKNKILIKEILANWGENCFLDKPEDGHINLQQMISNRLEQLGVPVNQIKKYSGDTYGELDEQGNHRWSSHVRDSGKEQFTNVTVAIYPPSL